MSKRKNAMLILKRIWNHPMAENRRMIVMSKFLW